MDDIKTTVDVAEEVAKEQASADANEEVETEVEETETVEEATAETKDIDWDKLGSVVKGKLAVTEDKVLKGFLEKQGLSEDEVKQAIATFKSNKAKEMPDIDSIQKEAETLKREAETVLERALLAEAQNKAMLLASEFGVNVKAMPYIVNMIKASNPDIIANGKVNEDKLKTSIEQVLTVMPQIKQSTVQGGFQTVGADTTKNAQSADETELERAFGIKK